MSYHLKEKKTNVGKVDFSSSTSSPNKLLISPQQASSLMGVVCSPLSPLWFWINHLDILMIQQKHFALLNFSIQVVTLISPS